MHIVQYWGGWPQMPNSKWRRFLHLLEACAQRGWKTHIVWSRMPDDPELSRPFVEAGCRILIQPRARGNFDWRCMLGTFRLLREVGCDIFHCHNVHTSPLIGAAAAGVPVRLWSKLSMSRQYEEGHKPKGLARFHASHRVSGALAHEVLCISTAVRDELRSEGLPAEKLHVVPIPVEIGKYATASGAGVREKLGIPAGSKVITAVGHAVRLKGWDVLVSAFGRIAGEAPDTQLVLVGSTTAAHERETAESLRGLVRGLGLESRIHFTGQCRDVAPVLAASDVFVLPSRSEGLSCALVEALAAGVPIVACRVGGVPDVIRHGDNGLLFEREDVAGLARALLNVLRDESLRERLGIRAQSSAERFGLDRITQNMLERYERLLGMAMKMPVEQAQKAG